MKSLRLVGVESGRLNSDAMGAVGDICGLTSVRNIEVKRAFACSMGNGITLMANKEEIKRHSPLRGSDSEDISLFL